MHDRVFWELPSAFRQEAQRPLVDAPFVENPAQGIGDVGLLGSDFPGRLSELECLFLVPTFLGVDVRQVIGRRGQPRVELQNRFVSHLGLFHVAILLVHHANQRAKAGVVRPDPYRVIQLGEGLLVLSRSGVDPAELHIGAGKPGVELDRL